MKRIYFDYNATTSVDPVVTSLAQLFRRTVRKPLKCALCRQGGEGLLRERERAGSRIYLQ